MNQEKASDGQKPGRRWDLLQTVALVLVFLIGLALVLYPPLSKLWNANKEQNVVLHYASQVSEQDGSEALSAAESYNASLAALRNPLSDYESVEGYDSLLNPNEDGVMGYITIPALDLTLPIRHGTSEAALASGVGHLQGSSLPVGGIGTHTVLTAHRGLPNATLFTDLDQLCIGDTFSVTVLDRTVTYEVDRIMVVEPDEREALAIEEDSALCTLVTCTPYGVNTQRLLVRGHQITSESASDNAETEQSKSSSDAGFREPNAWSKTIY